MGSEMCIRDSEYTVVYGSLQETSADILCLVLIQANTSVRGDTKTSLGIIKTRPSQIVQLYTLQTCKVDVCAGITSSKRYTQNAVLIQTFAPYLISLGPGLEILTRHSQTIHDRFRVL